MLNKNEKRFIRLSLNILLNSKHIDNSSGFIILSIYIYNLHAYEDKMTYNQYKRFDKFIEKCIFNDIISFKG